MWFWLSLASAILGAVDILFNKKTLKHVSPVVLFWAQNAFSIPLLLLFILKVGIPIISDKFYFVVIGSAITWAIGKVMYNHGLKSHLISQIIPLTSFGVIFTYFFGLLFLGQNIKLIPMLGLFSVIVGSYVLNVDQAREDILKPFKLIFGNTIVIIFLVGMLLTSMTAIFDKLSLENTFPSSVLFVILVENILETAIATPYLLFREKNTWIKEVKQNFGLLLLNSFVLLVIGFLIFNAYTLDGPVALVLGVKRLQIIFALLLGYLFLKDKPTKHSWLASLIMIAGTLMIKSA